MSGALPVSGGAGPASVATGRLAGVLGQPRAVALLSGALASGRVAPAYLFLGPEGTGKRTAARAFAAGLLCKFTVHGSRSTGDACGECRDCRDAARGTHEDLSWTAPPEGKRALPLEAALSAAGSLALRPSRGVRRVAVIEGADRATEEAANALLKTLEEPPGASVLVLVAETLLPLPPTVRSRCQVVRFGPLPEAVVREALAARGAPAAEAASLAGRAEGSLGRALAALGGARPPDPAALLGSRDDGRPVPAVAAEVLAASTPEAGTLEERRQALLALLAEAARETRGRLAGGGAREESRLRALVESAEALRRNAAPDLVVENLVLRLR
ncbi:MAG: hypothetical protein L0216_03885 [Planctomycetales bacterium]|nr:hypothetical protein [Planctomycetales bacterium]